MTSNYFQEYIVWRSSLVRAFPVGYSDKHFVNSSPDITTILFENRKRKVFEILEHLP